MSPDARDVAPENRPENTPEGPPGGGPEAGPGEDEALEAASHLLVRAGQRVCALPIGSVRRIVRTLTVHPLPGASEELLGLSEFAGEPLPVVSLARLIQAPAGAHPLHPVTVVVWAGEGERRETLGLAADAALDVVALPPASIVGGDGALIRGEAPVGDEVVRVLDLAALGRG